MPAQNLGDRHSLKILNMEPMNIPSNNSHQELISGSDECDRTSLTSVTDSAGNSTRRCCRISVGECLTIIILCYVNLINYMDRFTVAGVLKNVQDEFNIGDDLAGLLQTAFVLSYMIFAPLFGYLGDRYSRRWIMAFGVLLWSLTTLFGSFMNTYGWFLTFRALVGIGEASYSTIAPTIISDLYVKDTRSTMLALFYFAIPVGSGLGYIVGSGTASLAGCWRWALRVTPVMGVIAVPLIVFVLRDPERGKSEGSDLKPTTWGNDLRELCKNKSFMLSTFGFTCVSFVTGALAWWGPKFIHQGLQLQKGYENVTQEDVAYKFGAIAMAAGLVGVPLGSLLAQRLRSQFPRIDPLMCGAGLLVSMPLMFAASLSASVNDSACYALMFFGQVFLNLNWSIVADILLYVVIPIRRSTAEAFQILISHALGDAGSPYLVGLVSEALKHVLAPSNISYSAGTNGSLSLSSNVSSDILHSAGTNCSLSLSSNVSSDILHSSGTNCSLLLSSNASSNVTLDPVIEFHSLQYSLFMTCFVQVLGGLFFLLTALYITADRLHAERAIAGNGQPIHLYAEDAQTSREQSQNLVP